MFDHDIRLQDLESWDKYGTTGAALLEQLLVLVQEKLDEVSAIESVPLNFQCADPHVGGNDHIDWTQARLLHFEEGMPPGHSTRGVAWS